MVEGAHKFLELGRIRVSGDVRNAGAISDTVSHAGDPKGLAPLKAEDEYGSQNTYKKGGKENHKSVFLFHKAAVLLFCFFRFKAYVFPYIVSYKTGRELKRTYLRVCGEYIIIVKDLKINYKAG